MSVAMRMIMKCSGNTRCAQCPNYVKGECSVTARRIMPGVAACEYGRKVIAVERRENGHA